MEEIMRMLAIGNISMLAQIASREIEAKPDEVAEREAWLVRYLQTGEGLVTDEARAMAARVRAALAQPEATTEEEEER